MKEKQFQILRNLLKDLTVEVHRLKQVERNLLTKIRLVLILLTFGFALGLMLIWRLIGQA